MTKVDPNTQSLCVAASGNEVFLITLILEVTQNMSLRALVDCGASTNSIRRQSLDNRELEYVERKIPPTRMTVHLATGASVTMMKRVVGITYTLKGVQYNDDFIILDLDDRNLMLSLDCRDSEGTSHKSAGIDEQSIWIPFLHQMFI